MAESRSTSPPSEDMHWGISYLREHRKETGELRKEVAQQIADVRRDLRHNLYAMIGVSGIFATIIIAFIEYRLPAG